ncbi:MAG: Putative two-component sensor [uncultured Sulfurovum sp.]|uniref:histidine kinase n=1 Tax=uncultured Sulfurovum sp. TaxID=269237 RepID=A0A6S6TFE3_9BACT|nr:MAG: Putative two-component sensor [uncultured Sulfurovum sp.]
MKNLSVSTFIHILFSVAIAILIATFLLFLSWDRDRQKIEEFKRYQLISITFLSHLQEDPTEEKRQALYEDLRVLPLSKTEVKSLKKEIENIGNTVFSGGSAKGQVRVFDLRNVRYIYVQRMGHNLMFKDNKKKSFNFEYAVALGLFLIGLLLLLYLAVLKKLSPLKKLHKEIEAFADGKVNTRISYVYDDEIGKIAKSFDDAIVHIQELSASKNLFMRNLMHELKTPITKGRIVVEMLEDASTKKVLIRAFERMNELISELAELERVTTKSFEPKFEKIMLSHLVKSSQELLMSQKSCLKIDIEDMAMVTDKKLMTLVIKNLLDNGIKYGADACVMLQTNDGQIEVVSQGQPLKYPLAYYTEPFSQAEKRSSGFGLGLYIVHSILERLGCKLGYRHEEGKNIFMVFPKKA